MKAFPALSKSRFSSKMCFMKEKVVVVGAGPAGLFCAFLLLKRGVKVELYDHSSGPGKKFLVAGNGGLNLTHSEAMASFSKRYGKDSEFFTQLIQDYSPADLRDFCASIGVETFIGSSGRVFPKKLKAAQMLLNWVKELKSHEDFSLYLKHRLVGFLPPNELVFECPDGEKTIQSAKTILALGGASWKKTGSDGRWLSLLEKVGFDIAPLRPMNCGFERQWSKTFLDVVDHSPLKNVAIRFGDRSVRGEIMLTPFGVEGGAIYALSNFIRDEIERSGQAQIELDLKPDLSLEKIRSKLKERKTKDSMSNHLRKALGLGKSANTLLKELVRKEEYQDSSLLAERIKCLNISLHAARPIDEAISTSGGVKFSELDRDLQSRKFPGLFIVGEMLDFEAPTGGYLLQGCFSTAYRAVSRIISES